MKAPLLREERSLKQQEKEALKAKKLPTKEKSLVGFLFSLSKKHELCRSYGADITIQL